MPYPLKFVANLPPTIGKRVETNFEVFGSNVGHCTNCLCETMTTCAHFCGSFVCSSTCAAELQDHGHGSSCRAAARGIIPIVPRVFPLQLPKQATQEQRLQRIIDLMYSGEFAGNLWTVYAIADAGASAHVISNIADLGSERWKNGVHWALFCVLVSTVGERFMNDTAIDIGVLTAGKFQESYRFCPRSRNTYISENKGALMHQRLHLQHRAGVTSVSLQLDGISITQSLDSKWCILQKSRCFFDRGSLLNNSLDPVQLLATSVKQSPMEKQIRFIMDGINVNQLRSSRIQIVGLCTNMSYNGSLGTIIGSPTANQRVPVKLDSGKEILVKPENTKLLFRGAKGTAFIRETLSMRHDLYVSVHCMTKKFSTDFYWTSVVQDVVTAIACAEAWNAPVSAKIVQRGFSTPALMRGVQQLLNALYCQKEGKRDTTSAEDGVYMALVLSQWPLCRILRQFDGSHLWMILNMPPTGLCNVRVSTSRFGEEGLVAERAMQRGEIATFHPIDYLSMEGGRGVLRSRRAVAINRDPKSWNAIDDRHKLTNFQADWLEGLFGASITAVADPALRDRADLLGHLVQSPFKSENFFLAYQSGRSKRPNVGIKVIAGLWPALVCLQDVYEGEEIRLHFGENFEWNSVKEKIASAPRSSSPLQSRQDPEGAFIMNTDEVRRNAVEADIEKQNALAKLEKEARKRGGSYGSKHDLETTPIPRPSAGGLESSSVLSNRTRRRRAQKQKEHKREQKRLANIQKKESDEWIRKYVNPTIENPPRESKLNDALGEHGLPSYKSEHFQKAATVSPCEKNRMNASPYEDEITRDFMDAMQLRNVQSRISAVIDLSLISKFLAVTDNTKIPQCANRFLREEIETDLGLVLEACAGYARLQFLTKHKLCQALYKSQKAASS